MASIVQTSNTGRRVPRQESPAVVDDKEVKTVENVETVDKNTHDELVDELEEYKTAFSFLRDKLRVEVSVHPLDIIDIEFLLIILNKLTFEGKDVEQVFRTTIKLQDEFNILKEEKGETPKKFEN